MQEGDGPTHAAPWASSLSQRGTQDWKQLLRRADFLSWGCEQSLC